MARLISKDAIRSLANLYSPSVFRTIVESNSLSSIEKRIFKYKNEFLSDNQNLKFGNLMENVFSAMTMAYRNEYVYKNYIFNKLLLGKYSLNTTTLLNEFKIDKSIADLILVNGETKLFEIKTDLDSLKRLDSQLDNYRKAVEKIYVVTDTAHLEDLKFRYSTSKYGIIELSNRKTLRIHKEAEADRIDFDHKVLFKLLRKNEYLSIVKEEFGQFPDVPNTLIYTKCFEKISSMNVDSFQKLVFKKIKERIVSNPNLLMDEKTPSELRYLCYVNNLGKEQYQNLHNLLNIGI